MTEPTKRLSIVKMIKTTVTFTAREYEPILRKAAGAPETARVEIEDNYGGDITVSWEETTYEEGRD